MNPNAALLAAFEPTGGEVTTAERIGDAATLTSITLAVLSAFAAQRAASIAKQQADLKGVKLGTLKLDFAIDAALTAFGILLLVAAAPLFVAAWDEATPLLHTDTAFFALFCLFYAGVGLVIFWLATIARRRGRRLKDKAGGIGLLGALRKSSNPPKAKPPPSPP